MKMTIKHDGSLVIPAAWCKSLGIEPEATIHLTLEEDGLMIRRTQQVVAKSQMLLRSYVPEGRSLSQELIEERRL
ncbi:AbrB family transcriptional regulator [Dehalogenimonas lykanthroporepellens BL-DC-9]|nr:AbrB family transcriptional regulator [Dehalogenimonas lykanthroporepellens BL-DC-9]